MKYLLFILILGISLRIHSSSSSSIPPTTSTSSNPSKEKNIGTALSIDKQQRNSNTFIHNGTLLTVSPGSSLRISARSFIPSSVVKNNNNKDICLRPHSHSIASSEDNTTLDNKQKSNVNPRSTGSASSSRTPVHFTDVTAAAGVHGIHPQKQIKTSPNCLFDSWDLQRKIWNKGSFCMPEILTGGASTGDIDNDGYDDIYVTRLDTIDSLYRNNGNGTFTDITIESGLGLTQTIRSNAVALFDIDNDGDTDIFISTLGDKRMYLFVNDGTGYFTEEAIERGISLHRPINLPPSEGGLTSSFSIAVGDYDNDGYLDIYTTEWFPRLHIPENMVNNATGVNVMTTCKLFRNQGSTNNRPGYFRDTTWESGIRPKVGGVTYEEEQMNIDLWFSDKHQKRLRQILQALQLPSLVINERIQSVNAEAETMFRKEFQRNELMSKIFSKLDTVGHGSVDGRHLPYHYMEGFPYVGVFQFGAGFVDLNEDHYPELIVSGDFGTTQLYWNNRNGTFTAGPLHLLWDYFDNSMGASIGDINNDGSADILFTSMALKAPTRLAIDKFFPKAGIASNFEGNHLYLNDGKRLFTDIANKAGVKDTGWAWGGVLFDYDNDGWLDMAICNGMDDPETTDDDFAVNTPNAAFRNNGAHTPYSFSSVGNQLGLDEKRDGRGYFEFDYDKDGDIDLFLVNHADYPILYRNDGGNQNSYVRLKVIDRYCSSDHTSTETVAIHTDGSETSTLETSSYCVPRDSIGAKVSMLVRKGETPKTREIRSAAAFMAQGEIVAHFGLLNQDDTVYQIRIYWPVYNATRILYNVPVRTEFQIRAPDVDNAVLETDFLNQPTTSLCENGIPRIVSASIDSIDDTGALNDNEDNNDEVTIASSGLWLKYTAVPFSENTAKKDGSRNPVRTLSVDLLYPSDGSDRLSVRIQIMIKDTTDTSSFPVRTESSLATGTATVVKPWDEILAHCYVEFAAPRSFQQPSYESGQSIYWEPSDIVHKVFERKSRVANNLLYPDWGTPGTPFLRLLPPFYADPMGNHLPGGKRYKGLLNKLPSSREISNRIMAVANYGYEKSPLSSMMKDQPSQLYPGVVYHRPPVSHLFTYFTMFLAHDMYNIYPEYWWEIIDKPSVGTEHEHNIVIPSGDPVWDSNGNGNGNIHSSPEASTTASKGETKNTNNKGTPNSMPFHRSPYIYVPTTYNYPNASTYNATVLSFTHPYVPSITRRTSLRYRQQLNTVSHYLDMHTIYGTDPLRTGRLIHPYSPPGAGQFILARLPNTDQLDPKVKEKGSTVLSSIQQSILPFDDPTVPAGNANPLQNEPQNLFLGGDNRLNMHPGLVTIHTLFVREHNRLYRELGTKPEFGGINGPPIVPTGKHTESIRGMINDKNITLYAVVASIVRAQYQSILWNEYLPVLFGTEYYASLPSYRGYNSSVNPSVLNEFATGAFEFYLSMLHDDIPRILSNQKSHRKGSISMINSWYNPVHIAYEGGIDSIIRGGWYQPANNVDVIITESVRNGYLGAKKKGLDLLALTLQRGRDHGLPTYQYVRQYYGLPLYRSFTELVNASTFSTSSITKQKLVQKLKELYQRSNDNNKNRTTLPDSDTDMGAENDDDVGNKDNNNNDDDTLEQEGVNRIDLYLGGLLEKPLPGGIIGPTFAALIKDQFIRLRDGDRFWYENTDGPMGTIINRYVSLEQIQKFRLLSLVKRNSGLYEDDIQEEELRRSSTTVRDGTTKQLSSLFYVRRKDKDG